MVPSQRQTKVRKVESDLSTKLGREPTDEETSWWSRSTDLA